MNHCHSKIAKASFFCFWLVLCSKLIVAQSPNILLVISDDLGVDVTNGYPDLGGNLAPTTPTLDSLMAVGLTFDNVWAAPVCSPTRAAIMSGKYGVKNGVTRAPGNLDENVHISIFKALEMETNDAYADAVVGKWHISSNPSNPNHPLDHGADYYLGVLGSSVADYYDWEMTYEGNQTQVQSYVTSTLTDTASAWINRQSQPWLMWLAHVAPHTPSHTPPANSYTISPTNSNVRKYIAAIEALDYELNELFSNLSQTEKQNTLVIYIGDNGTPNNFTQGYPNGNAKSSLYEGGVHVPMIVSGAGVSRQGENESAMVHAADIYATILKAAGADLDGGIYNSLSFHHLLNGDEGPTRDYNYVDFSEGGDNWAIRNNQYKLISNANGSKEFYDLINDTLELNNLINSPSSEQMDIISDLETEANSIRTDWSCRDHIKNGDEEEADCGGSNCEACSTTSILDFNTTNSIEVFPNPGNSEFIIRSNDIPIKKIELFDALGRRLYIQRNLNNYNYALQLNYNISGVHYLIVHTVKFVKKIKVIVVR